MQKYNPNYDTFCVRSLILYFDGLFTFYLEIETRTFDCSNVIVNVTSRTFKNSFWNQSLYSCTLQLGSFYHPPQVRRPENLNSLMQFSVIGLTHSPTHKGHRGHRADMENGNVRDFAESFDWSGIGLSNFSHITYFILCLLLYITLPT